jgi:ribosome-binding protein aMBF1 (putative translation factor)
MEYQVIDLAGTRYAVLPERQLRRLLRQAGIQASGTVPAAASPGTEAGDLELFDTATLAGRLLERRRAAGLSQAVLARRAGVRVETLNRVERGRTVPDFKTIRKLVMALKEAEQELGR